MPLDILLDPSIIVTPFRPIWYTTFQLNAPLGETTIDAVQLAAALTFNFRLQIMLYDVFNRQSRRGSPDAMSRDIAQDSLSFLVTYSYPLYEATEADGSQNTVAINSIAFGVLLFLETLLGEGPPVSTSTTSGRNERSIQEDQLEVFRQIEDNISALGVDGHSCILRFICEMQTNRFSRSSIFGELFTLLFTPKPGGDYTVLKDYISAEQEGRQEDRKANCLEMYKGCPVSVFDLLRRLRGEDPNGFSTLEDKPRNTTIPAGFSQPEGSTPWQWDANALGRD